MEKLNFPKLSEAIANVCNVLPRAGVSNGLIEVKLKRDL